VPDGLVNTELNLDFFKRNFTKEFITANVEKITFCGDDGDPIYAHDLIPVIEYIKSIKPVEIVIVTNGSHKRVSWWTALAKTLDSKDTIHFSIDGYNNSSNILYRINSDRDSIFSGIVAVRENSSCKIVWDAIAFKFNENYIEVMKAQAQALGIDEFQLTKSTKFGSVYPIYGVDDPLQPSAKFISKSHRFEREITVLSNNNRPQSVSPTNIKLYTQATVQNQVVPLCEIGNKGLYIDARGRLFPCCWVANRYDHNNEWQTLAEKFNLHHRTLTDAIADPFWENEFKEFKWQECQQKCNKNIVNEEYCTSW
jgi:molybdenum cofactor biosynthesis enzyme MoaA